MPESRRIPTAEWPLWACQEWQVQATCFRCDRSGSYRLADAAGVYGGDWTLGEFTARFRCAGCGQQPDDITLLSPDPGVPVRAIRIRSR